MLSILLESQLRQSEQLNGYYLVSFNGVFQGSREELLGKTFVFPQYPDIELTLFMLPNEAKGNFQLLSKIALPETCLQTDLPCKIEQKSSTQQTHQLPNNADACLIMADAKFMASAFAVAKHRQVNSKAPTVVFLEGEVFPFVIKPARFWAPEMPDEAIGASALLEDWQIMNRIASTELLPGCFHGYLVELLEAWASRMPDKEAWQLIAFTEEHLHKKNLQICQQYSWLKCAG